MPLWSDHIGNLNAIEPLAAFKIWQIGILQNKGYTAISTQSWNPEYFIWASCEKKAISEGIGRKETNKKPQTNDSCQVLQNTEKITLWWFRIFSILPLLLLQLKKIFLSSNHISTPFQSCEAYNPWIDCNRL